MPEEREMLEDCRLWAGLVDSGGCWVMKGAVFQWGETLCEESCSRQIENASYTITGGVLHRCSKRQGEEEQDQIIFQNAPYSYQT